MRFFDLVSIIFSNLGRRKGRVALTAIGVVIGTAAVVLLVSLVTGLQANATSQLYGIGDLKRIEVYPGYSEKTVSSSSSSAVAKDIYGGGGGQMINLTTQAIQDIAAIPGVSAVIPRDYLYGGSMLKYGKLENYANVLGVDTTDLSVFDYTLKEGTLNLERGTAIIGGWMAKNFYDPNLRPGQDAPEQPELLNQQVKLVISKWSMDGQEVKKTVTLRIVGVLQESRSESDQYLFVNMADLPSWNEWINGTLINRAKDGYNTVVVRAESVDQVTDIADQINAMGFMANTPQTYVESINSFYTVLQIMFGGVGTIALLVAAIGIANTMTMAILERTREIGLLKAIGATNRDVLIIFLGEAAGIGLIGGLGGVLLGWGGSKLINIVGIAYLANQAAQNGGSPPPSTLTATPLWLPIFALVFSLAVGLLSGLYPALQAATLVPVNALKYE